MLMVEKTYVKRIHMRMLDQDFRISAPYIPRFSGGI